MSQRLKVIKRFNMKPRRRRKWICLNPLIEFRSCFHECPEAAGTLTCLHVWVQLLLQQQLTCASYLISSSNNTHTQVFVKRTPVSLIDIDYFCNDKCSLKGASNKCQRRACKVMLKLEGLLNPTTDDAKRQDWRWERTCNLGASSELNCGTSGSVLCHYLIIRIQSLSEYFQIDLEFRFGNVRLLSNAGFRSWKSWQLPLFTSAKKTKCG